MLVISAQLLPDPEEIEATTESVVHLSLQLRLSLIIDLFLAVLIKMGRI